MKPRTTPRHYLISEIKNHPSVATGPNRENCPSCSTTRWAGQLCIHLQYVDGVQDPAGERKPNGLAVFTKGLPTAQLDKG
jgi:hypothetical protein